MTIAFIFFVCLEMASRRSLLRLAFPRFSEDSITIWRRLQYNPPFIQQILDHCFFPIVGRDTWIYMICSVPNLYHVFSYLLCYFCDIICAPLTLLSHTFILPISQEINLTQYKLHSFCLCTSIHTAERSCKATHHWTQFQFCASIATVLQRTEMLH